MYYKLSGKMYYEAVIKSYRAKQDELYELENRQNDLEENMEDLKEINSKIKELKGWIAVSLISFGVLAVGVTLNLIFPAAGVSLIGVIAGGVLEVGALSVVASKALQLKHEKGKEIKEIFRKHKEVKKELKQNLYEYVNNKSKIATLEKEIEELKAEMETEAFKTVIKENNVDLKKELGYTTITFSRAEPEVLEIDPDLKMEIIEAEPIEISSNDKHSVKDDGEESRVVIDHDKKRKVTKLKKYKSESQEKDLVEEDSKEINS